MNRQHAPPESDDETAPLLGNGQTTVQSEANGITPVASVISGKEKRRRLIRTICMVFFYTALGLYCTAVSVSLLDLQELLDCNVQQISIPLMLKAVGILVGSLTGATVSDRYRHHSDVALCVAGVVTGVCNIAMPWSPNLIVFDVLMLLQGVGHGTINVICSSVTIGEWGENSAAPVNFLHTFFSVGNLIAPSTTAPFLLKTHGDQNMTARITSEENSPWSSLGYSVSEVINPYIADHDIHTNFSFIGNNSRSATHIYIPFTIHGGLAISAGFLFLAFYIAGWKYQSASNQETPPSNEESQQSESVPRSDLKFTTVMLIALLFIYVPMINRDTTLATFNFYILVTSLHVGKPHAAVYSTVYSASWVVGRFFGTILTKFLRVHWLVFGGVFLTLADSVCLIFFGLHTEVFYWVLTCAIGVFSGPSYPSVMAWADNYIVVKGFVVAVIDIGIGLGAMIGNLLGGYILHNYGPIAVFILLAACTGCMALILVPLQIACSVRGNRFRKEVVKNDENNIAHEPLAQ